MIGDYCEEGRQTLPHLILHCKKFKVERGKHFVGITQPTPSLILEHRLDKQDYLAAQIQLNVLGHAEDEMGVNLKLLKEELCRLFLDT